MAKPDRLGSSQPSAASAAGAPPAGHRLGALTVAAIGVVYGDIGTSPLYAMREAFGRTGGLPLGETTVLGVLSLVFWALTLVVTVKYVTIMLRADHQGEGGVLALGTLAHRALGSGRRRQRMVVLLMMLGAALFCGDGVITPAISVLSAVEGLEVITPAFEPYVVPLALGILTGLFLIQRRGTAGVAALFGPVMCLWFATLAGLGLTQIVGHPDVLRAIDPTYAITFLTSHRWQAFVALGAIVLVVTGAEALYTDMGHFGRRPIRRAWFSLVMPALLLNYFGQGALLLHEPGAVSNPFYLLVPSWALQPLVVLATAATVIASQAVLSGVFSVTRQAVQLGYLPRMEIRHTSEHQIGQVYLPRINWLLMVAVIAVVLGFGSSSQLAGAYGIAVVGAMTIDVLLGLVVAIALWRWHPLAAGLAFAAFLTVDLGLLGATLLKVPAGGWFPIVLAAVVLTSMSIWRRGRAAMFERLYRHAAPLRSFPSSLAGRPAPRVSGTAVFLTATPDAVPRALLHNLKHNKALHERVVVLNVVTADVPRIPDAQRLEIEHLGANIHRVRIHYGFMERPDVTGTVLSCQLGAPEPTLMDTSFFVSRDTFLPSERPDLPRWQAGIFIWMASTALDATRFFGLPPDRVVELGTQVQV